MNSDLKKALFGNADDFPSFVFETNADDLLDKNSDEAYKLRNKFIFHMNDAWMDLIPQD